jgi:LPXTG-site transpeptidase (sortase) family protein
MRSKILLKWSFSIVGITGIVFFSIIIFVLTHGLAGQGAYAKLASLTVDQAPRNMIDGALIESVQGAVFPEQASPGLPIRLKIPKISVDVALEYVGLTREGAMDIPKNQDAVAWFKLGWRPGENGSAVIAGHYGWKNGKGSAFDDLYKLRKGDKLYVEDDKGEIISFVVSKNRRYDPKADSSGVFSSNDGNSHLNLVTCEGDWDAVSKSYSQRLVVFADKE